MRRQIAPRYSKIPLKMYAYLAAIMSYVKSKLSYFDFYKKYNWGIEFDNKYLKNNVLNSFARGCGQNYLDRSLEELWFKDVKVRFGVAYFLCVIIIFFVMYPLIPHTFYLSRLGFSANICFELVLFIYIFVCFTAHFGLLKKVESRGSE